MEGVSPLPSQQRESVVHLRGSGVFLAPLGHPHGKCVHTDVYYGSKAQVSYIKSSLLNKIVSECQPDTCPVEQRGANAFSKFLDKEHTEPSSPDTAAFIGNGAYTLYTSPLYKIKSG